MRHRHSCFRRFVLHAGLSLTVIVTVGLAAVVGGAGEAASATVGDVLTTASAPNVRDTMTRTVSGGFGTADLGGVYVTSPASKFSVSGGAGHIATISAGGTVSAALPGTVAADEQFQSTFSLPSLPSHGSGVGYAVVLRQQAVGDAYLAQVIVGPRGVTSVSLLRRHANVYTTLGTARTQVTATAGSPVVVEGAVSGSVPVSLRTRVYQPATTVPDWQLALTDASVSAVVSPGSTGLLVRVASDSSNTKVTVMGATGWPLVGPSPSPSPSPSTSTTTSSPAIAPTSAATTSPTATLSPLSSSTASAPTTTTYPVPTSIAFDCSVDTTSALVAFVNGLPDNSTILFAANGCYLVQGTMEFRSRNGLTFDGNGATIKATLVADDTRSDWRFIYGSHLAFRNMSIVGADIAGGTSTAFTSALQHQMGIDLRGVAGVEIANVAVSQTYGDCFYVGVGYDNSTWSSDVSIHDTTCARNGRSGMSVTAGRSVTFDHNVVSRPGLWGVDIEPNGGSTGAIGVTVSNSAFSPGGHLEPFVQAVGNSGGGVVDGITVRGNTVHGMTLSTRLSPAAGQRWTNFTFSANTSDTAGYYIYNNDCGCVVVVNASDIDGLTVQDNYQPAPGSDETFLYTTASCSITQSGNVFPNGGAVATVQSYQC